MISPSQARILASVLAAAALASGMVIGNEGKRNWVYRDPVGVLTVCYGHTGPELRLGQVYSDLACEQMLDRDLDRTAREIAPAIHRELPQPILIASADFAFNVGSRAFNHSTLLRKLNAGDLKGACAEFARWTFAKHRQLPGLVARRARERAECEKGIS